MTEQERLERERDWVATRFRCTVDNLFEELVAVIESDIESFIKVSGRDDCKIVRDGDKEVSFKRYNRTVFVSTDGKMIRISPKHGDSWLSCFTINPKWNEDEMRCDLVIDGETISMHRASQKIIGRVLFPGL